MSQHSNNFYEYFTSQVNNLNKKQIAKSVIDGVKFGRSEFYAPILHICDYGDCLEIVDKNIDDIVRINSCDDCLRVCCDKCVPKSEYKRCVECRITSCQQQGCVRNYFRKKCRGRAWLCQRCHQIDLRKKEINDATDMQIADIKSQIYKLKNK